MPPASAATPDALPLAERLFLALPLEASLNAALQSALAPWRPSWPPRGRATPPQQWHVTLRFLGQGRPQQAGDLVDQLDTCPLRLPDRPLRLTGFGAFPVPRAARVLWLGIGAAERQGLLDLAEVVEAQVRRAGYGAEARRYRPHLTLCRFSAPEDLSSCLAAAPAADLPWSPTRLVLFRSRLLPGGAEHQELRSWALDRGHPGEGDPEARRSTLAGADG